ncbi:glutathione S-transferase [Mucor mucedo]|uniref:glutathione S-transferase n=1 Tax=Mucor mucedo TaxID=29922 RepID=UPI0022208806|nr:glutathione S-transferase [Mucor mucedo]KAI7892892.1 glutathione S-transferase [Mucor mucedo]
MIQISVEVAYCLVIYMEKITLYYFDNGNSVPRGRGENVKLMLEDAGLNHEYVRLAKGEAWGIKKAQLLKDGYISPTLPYIEINGSRFGKTAPIMRYISAKLDNKYNGSNAEENHFLEYVTEITECWFDCVKNAFFGDDEKKAEHRVTSTPKYIDLFEKLYTTYTGPYLIGEKITYVDFLVYHLLDDDFALNRLSGSPNLAKFVQSFEQRPNMKNYLASLTV